MTNSDSEQQQANNRLVAAMKMLNVFSRIDEDGRILAFDGKQEYEVTVDLSRLLTRPGGSVTRRIAVGKSSLARLEKGDLAALFEAGLAAPEEPYSGPLQLSWDRDPQHPGDRHALTANVDGWNYSISPVRGYEDEIIGYQVSGGDYESSDEFGSSLIAGKPGELTVEKAKAAAEANYAHRTSEADGLLDDLLGDWEDGDGVRFRRDGKGGFICRVDEPSMNEVRVVATLQDYGDHYDPTGQCVTVCLRTVLSCGGDRMVLLDELRRIIREQAEGDE